MWRVLFTLMVIGLCGKATAETGLLTLQQAVASALERNPQRKAALAEVRSAQASIKEARSEYFPRLGFTESVVRSNDPVFVFGARLRQNRFTAADFTLDRLNTPAPLDNFATRFGLHWKVFDSFVTESSVRQAVREKAASEQQLARTDQLIVFQVIQAYYGVLFASRQIEVAEHAVATSQSLLQQSRARFEAGSTVESDYLAAQVDYASRQQELVRARNVLALARAQLNIAMGMDPDREYTTVEPASPQDFQPPSLTEAEARALQERPDLKQSSEQVAAREAGVRSAKSAFGPRVNLFAASELDSANVFGNSGSNWTAGAE
ncbi:MAG TPA: TolC family protein, partial [Alphaproteobacteria bacterium]|nr:TolC family protein [Alphaproteobacteria bacterium]